MLDIRKHHLYVVLVLVGRQALALVLDSTPRKLALLRRSAFFGAGRRRAGVDRGQRRQRGIAGLDRGHKGFQPRLIRETRFVQARFEVVVLTLLGSLVRSRARVVVVQFRAGDVLGDRSTIRVVFDGLINNSCGCVAALTIRIEDKVRW